MWWRWTIAALAPDIGYNYDHTNANDQAHNNGVSSPPWFDHRHQIIDSRHGICWVISYKQERKTGEVPLRTFAIRVLIPAKEVRCRENSERVSYAWLENKVGDSRDRHAKIEVTHFKISSVIRWELSILPRSASRESVAEDLYVLIVFRTGDKSYGHLYVLDIVSDTTEEVGLI